MFIVRDKKLQCIVMLNNNENILKTVRRYIIKKNINIKTFKLYEQVKLARKYDSIVLSVTESDLKAKKKTKDFCIKRNGNAAGDQSGLPQSEYNFLIRSEV